MQMRWKKSDLFSIVVPAKDEEETIENVLNGLIELSDDLIVIDGHSRDRTPEIVRSMGISLVKDNNKGKGDAVKVGLPIAKNPIIVFIDADGSHNPADIEKLVNPIINNEADLVMGSRMLGGSEELYGSISEVCRLIGSLIISLSINYRFGVRFTDYQNGFRALRKDAALKLNLKSDITTIEQEMSIKFLKNGYKVIEVPTHEYKRKGGKSKINVFKVAHIYIWVILRELLFVR